MTSPNSTALTTLGLAMAPPLDDASAKRKGLVFLQDSTVDTTWLADG